MKLQLNGGLEALSRGEGLGEAPLSTYQSLLSKYTAKANLLKQQLRWFSLFRLLFFCGFIFLGYKAIQTGDRLFIFATLFSLIIFLFFIRITFRYLVFPHT